MDEQKQALQELNSLKPLKKENMELKRLRTCVWMYAPGSSGSKDVVGKVMLVHTHCTEKDLIKQRLENEADKWRRMSESRSSRDA